LSAGLLEVATSTSSLAEISNFPEADFWPGITSELLVIRQEKAKQESIIPSDISSG
jgi:hypothetical protein